MLLTLPCSITFILLFATQLMVFGSYGPTGQLVHIRVGQTASSIGNGTVTVPYMAG